MLWSFLADQHQEETQRTHGLLVPSGHYEFNKLPFGLSKNPSSFQRLIEVVFKGLVGTECWVFRRRCNYIFPVGARTCAEAEKCITEV